MIAGLMNDVEDTSDKVNHTIDEPIEEEIVCETTKSRKTR